MSVDVGVWVLGLSVFGEDTGRDLIHLADQLEHGVLRQLAKGELSLGDVARIGLAQDGVAVARDDTAGVKGVPEVFGDVGVTQVRADGLLHLGEPIEHFLVGTVAVSIHLEALEESTYSPWRGPARPLRPADRDSIGELRALPTKWVV